MPAAAPHATGRQPPSTRTRVQKCHDGCRAPRVGATVRGLGPLPHGEFEGKSECALRSMRGGPGAPCDRRRRSRSYSWRSSSGAAATSAASPAARPSAVGVTAEGPGPRREGPVRAVAPSRVVARGQAAARAPLARAAPDGNARSIRAAAPTRRRHSRARSSIRPGSIRSRAPRSSSPTTSRRSLRSRAAPARARFRRLATT